MMDTCQILVYSSTPDDYGNPDETYAAGSAISCGLHLVQPDEVQDTGQVAVIDARLRLPIDTELDPRDRIQVTHRFGEALATAQVYEIVGPPRRGPSGLVVDLVTYAGVPPVS